MSSPYINRNCRCTMGNMNHVCHIEARGPHMVELIGMGFAEPYHVATLGIAVLADMVTSGEIIIIGSAIDLAGRTPPGA